MKPHRAKRSIDYRIGLRLAARRRQLQLSVDDVALATRIAAAELDLFERGAKRVPAALLLRLADHLGLETDHFTGERPPGDHGLPSRSFDDEIARFLGAAEARALIEAFNAIADPDERRAVLKVAQMIRDGVPDLRLH